LFFDPVRGTAVAGGAGAGIEPPPTTFWMVSTMVDTMLPYQRWDEI